MPVVSQFKTRLSTLMRPLTQWCCPIKVSRLIMEGKLHSSGYRGCSAKGGFQAMVEPVGYRVRLRVRIAKALNTEDASQTINVAGREVQVRSQKPNQRLSEAV